MFTAVSGEGAFRGSIQVAARPPDSIWIKIEGPLGIDLLTARMAGGQIAYYSPWMKNSAPDSADLPNFSGFLPAGLDSLTALTGLFGLPMPKNGMSDSLRSVSIERSRTLLRVGADESIWIESRGPVISRWEKRGSDGSLVWAYEAGQFKSSGGLRIPKKIRFVRNEDSEVVLYYEQIHANKPLKRGWCDVRIPKGAENRTL